jgi:hypothetical protein
MRNLAAFILIGAGTFLVLFGGFLTFHQIWPGMGPLRPHIQVQFGWSGARAATEYPGIVLIIFGAMLAGLGVTISN